MVRRREIGYFVSGSWVSNIVRETTYLHIVMVEPSRIRKSDFFCAQKKNNVLLVHILLIRTM